MKINKMKKKEYKGPKAKFIEMKVVCLIDTSEIEEGPIGGADNGEDDDDY